MKLFAVKTAAQLKAESIDETHGLRRVLGPWHLVFLGIGAVIGTGIFVLTGHAAAEHAGPAVALSYVLSGVGCLFAGLCYAEYAAMIPVAGSAYTYTYATLGELMAWIIGWDLILEYLFASSTVAVGWSKHFGPFLQDVFGVQLPAAISSAPWDYMASTGQFVAIPGAMFNLPAMVIIALVSILLVIGIRESAIFNNVMVVIKVLIILLVIGFGIAYINMDNLTPFIPENEGSGRFGWSGVLRAAGVIFFAYIGFDAVSTAAQETRNPQKDMPRGMLGSLTICGVLFVAMSIVLCGMVSYKELRVDAPVVFALEKVGGDGLKWLRISVEIAVLAGLSSVILVMLMGQPRIFFSMARDGLLPASFGKVHPKFRTPYIPTIITGVVAAVLSGFLPINFLGELVSIGTLMAFTVVCVGVIILRHTQPDVPRPFRTPFSPWFPALGAVLCLMQALSLGTPNYIRLLVWLAIGLVIYFTYSVRNSHLQRALSGGAGTRESSGGANDV